MRYILTTVGISLFTNYQRVMVQDHYGRDYQSIDRQLSEIQEVNPGSLDIYSANYKHNVQSIREEITDFWFEYEDIPNEKASAEIDSSLKIAKENPDESFEIHLIATDTLLSVLAAEMIAEWFRIHSPRVATNIQAVRFVRPDPNTLDESKHVVEDLKLENKNQYEKGVGNLLKLLDELYQRKTEEKGTSVEINISGGYKAILPTTTLFGQLSKIPIRYLFNGEQWIENPQMVSVPMLPIDFDYSIFEDEFLAFQAINPEKKSHNHPSPDEFRSHLMDEANFNLFKQQYLIEDFHSVGEAKEDKLRVRLHPLGNILFKRYEEIYNTGKGTLLGKIMEWHVYRFFDAKHSGKVQMGKTTGPEGYDLDVFVEDGDTVWGIEVKPQNVRILGNKDSMQKKCEEGAFFHTKEKYKDKNLRLAFFMYHHLQPHEYHERDFAELKKLEHPCQDFLWIWIKPPSNYKTSVNWEINEARLKQYNFESRKWEKFSWKHLVTNS